MNNKTVLERLSTMADQLERATHVPNRSVRIIKLVCDINAIEAHAIRMSVATALHQRQELLTACEAAHVYVDNIIEHQETMGKAVAEDTLEVHELLLAALTRAKRTWQ